MIHKSLCLLLTAWLLLIALPKSARSIETNKSSSSKSLVKKVGWHPFHQNTRRRNRPNRVHLDPTEGDDIRGEDLEVRKIAVDALGKQNGLIVIVNPTNGRILTIVNQRLALSTGFQPCSTFKPAVALAALKEGIVTENTKIRVNRRTYMTMTKAIAVSNNRFFATLGRRLKFSRVREYAMRWGFGQKAGWKIEGEDPGTFPDQPPRRGVGYLSSHGAGIKATALQMAAFVSALANGGKLYYLQYPRTTEEILSFYPRLKRKLMILKYLPEIRDAMAATVLYGTGSIAYDHDHTIYGKTGTCSEKRIRLGWFVSHADSQNPKYVVIVLLRGNRRIRGVNDGPSDARIAGQVYLNMKHDQSIPSPFVGRSWRRNPHKVRNVPGRNPEWDSNP